MSDVVFPGWNGKSDEEKEIIFELLKLDGFATDGDTVIDGNVAKGLGSKLCEIACAAAQAAAVGACSGNAVCIAAAIAAGEACKRAC